MAPFTFDLNGATDVGRCFDLYYLIGIIPRQFFFQSNYHCGLWENQKSLQDYGLYQLNLMFIWTLVMLVAKYVAHYIFLQKLPKFSIMSSLAVLIL